MNPAQRSFWLRQLQVWHWVSAALSLVGMLGFALTGVTLNHAADIPSVPKIETRAGAVPPATLKLLLESGLDGEHQLPEHLLGWLRAEMSIRLAHQTAEWSENEIYISMPRPGGDAWLSIDLETGEAMFETTARGWVAYFNDLHKARDTGNVWRWFLDVFAFACIVFCITGLVLLQFHAKRRPSTWPMVGLGFLAPVILLIIFVH